MLLETMLASAESILQMPGKQHLENEAMMCLQGKTFPDPMAYCVSNPLGAVSRDGSVDRAVSCCELLGANTLLGNATSIPGSLSHMQVYNVLLYFVPHFAGWPIGLTALSPMQAPTSFPYWGRSTCWQTDRWWTTMTSVLGQQSVASPPYSAMAAMQVRVQPSCAKL